MANRPYLTVDNEARGRLDADILINASDPRDPGKTFLVGAQTISGAMTTASALRYHGLDVHVRVWNGRAYSEERI